MTRPTVYRALSEPRVWAWMPYGDGTNRRWLHARLGERIRPEWNKHARRWEVSRRHLRPLVDALAEKFGEVEVTLEFSTKEQCDSRCQTAMNDDCQCSCLGENHGGGVFLDWIVVSDTTLIRHERYVRTMVVRHRG